MTRATNPNLDYIRKLYAPEDALQKEINASLAAMNMSIQVGAEEGKLLQFLVKTNNIKTIVEIGTLGGYSAIWMARGLTEGGHIYTLERDPKHAALARGFFEKSDVKDKITLLEGNALDTLSQLSAKAPFDMVFIDADKISYDTYLDWAETNVRKGGLIVGDNTLLFGAAAQDSPPESTAPTTWKNMRSFNERMADTSKYYGLIIPTQEGLSVFVKLF
ncbi:MAG: O-methyltransferase [Alphaproteobacteria bacterium]